MLSRSIHGASTNKQSSVPRDSHWLRTPKSSATSSDEVFELASSWLIKCNSHCDCARPMASITGNRDKFYPKRLLDLSRIRSATGLRDTGSLTFLSQHADLERVRLRLIETSAANIQHTANNRYVTLSHCWGKPRSVQGQLKLTSRNEPRFKNDGIELREVSKTFRDAILFASRLEQVGYIWIDSLCIKQQSADPGVDPKDSANDWLEQSRVMDRVYRESWLNISATAASDGDQGLFFDRRPEDLWEDEINLNVTDLAPSHLANREDEDSGQTLVHSAIEEQARWPDTSNNTQWGDNKRPLETNGDEDIPKKIRKITTESLFALQRSAEHFGRDFMKRCMIIDAAFWDDLIKRAPVNGRAWVLQERLMAPRVLHFCHNQIAWECAGFQEAEGFPEGLPPLTTKFGDVVVEGRLKALTPEVGQLLRQMRLKGFEDPDKDLPNLHRFELWKRVVETYSATSLTVSSDKLIALSGMARQFWQWIGSDYVAGMWRIHLESQLLWQVNEVFKDGVFENPAKRDPLRAPSFSWASIDTPHGVTYGEATDYQDDPSELLFKVQSCQLFLYDTQNPFGMIEEGWGFVQVVPRYFRKIKLRRLQPPYRVPYSWSLEGNLHTQHFNIYLDAPNTDVDIFQSDAELYCMPAAYGERTVKKSSRYLICLLLKLDRSKNGYKRFGITKLSNYKDQEGQGALKEVEYNQVIKIY